MRIGIDLTVLDHRRTGIGNYAFHLASELLWMDAEHEWVLFVPGNIGDQRDWEDRAKVVKLPAKHLPIWSAHVRYARIMKEQKLDVLHGVANTLPLFYSGKSVITIHDLAIYKHPEWFERGQWFAKKIVAPRSIKKANKIIVPSVTTKKALIELFHVPEEKIAVIVHGVEERFFKSPPFSSRLYHGQENNTKYILAVGTIEPRKNHVALLDAYAKLPENIRNQYELVIAGARGWGTREFDLKLDSLKSEITAHIKIMNYASDEHLPALYKHASLFVYPSLYEGFGLPVLEAMAAGIPVVTSKGSAMAETVSSLSSLGGEPKNYVSFVDPASVEEIREAMVKALSNSHIAKIMGEQGAEFARHFTWRETAQNTLKVYRSLV